MSTFERKILHFKLFFTLWSPFRNGAPKSRAESDEPDIPRRGRHCPGSAQAPASRLSERIGVSSSAGRPSCKRARTRRFGILQTYDVKRIYCPYRAFSSRFSRARGASRQDGFVSGKMRERRPRHARCRCHIRHLARTSSRATPLRNFPVPFPTAAESLRPRPSALLRPKRGMRAGRAVGSRRNAKGRRESRAGCRPHIDAADGRLPAVVSPRDSRGAGGHEHPGPQGGAVRHGSRSAVERVGARLKDDFCGRHVHARGHAKVFAQIVLGVLAPTINRLRRHMPRHSSFDRFSGVWTPARTVPKPA